MITDPTGPTQPNKADPVSPADQAKAARGRLPSCSRSSSKLEHYTNNGCISPSSIFPSIVWPFLLNFNAKVTPFSMVNPFRELFHQFIVLIVETDVVHRLPPVDI
jgi:hypothetical protein